MSAQPRITQEDMAGRVAKYGLQLTQAQVAKLENGVRPILDFELIAIAKALKVPLQDLFP